MNKDTIIGFIAIVALVLGGWALLRTGVFSNGASTLGAAFSGSGMLAENYIPYVMYNGGYNSAKDIATTGNVNGAIGTFSGALSAAATTLSGTLTVTTSNAATSTVIAGCYQFYATSTATAQKFMASTTPGVMYSQYGTCP